MDIPWQKIIWDQFGAAIDTLGDVLDTWPDELWREQMWVDPDRPEYGEFWFLVYHTLRWIDLYLDGSGAGFRPPALFDRYRLDADRLPATPYTRADLQAYLAHCREKCRTTLAGLTDESAQRACHFDWIGDDLTFIELQLYSMRHVQEHAAQFQLVLGKKTAEPMDWVPRARPVAA